MWKNQGFIFTIVFLCCLGRIVFAYQRNILPKQMRHVVNQICGIEEETNEFGKGIVENEKTITHPEGVNLTELQKKKEEEKARQDVIINRWISDMSLEQKLAQLMVLTNEKDITQSNLTRYQPGGVILFGVDFDGKTIREVRSRIDRMQQAVSVPLLVGVDEEGGDISRIRGLNETKVPEFKSARQLYRLGKRAVQKESEQKADILQQLGVNMNFDPVADVVNAPEAYMYERSASGSAVEVSEYVGTIVSVMLERKIGTCLKHFPGYGNNANTHKTFAEDNKKLEEYRKVDFLPYQVGIVAGADMVMVSHITMKVVDAENPASLSRNVHDLLRKEFRYDGVVIADDLNMQAILRIYTIEEATEKAFAAGNDMIFSADFEASMKGARQALQDGVISEQQIDESVRRVLRYKCRLTDEETSKDE